MRTKKLLLACLSAAILLISSILSVNAQETEDDYFVISGVVKDIRTKKTLENVNVTALGTNVGTVTNADGEFSLKINKSLDVSRISFSNIGYLNSIISISKNSSKGRVFNLTPESYLLSEVQVFSWRNPRDLIKAAIEKIETNYEAKPNKLTGFYRETVQKGRKYINISEAVIEMYKSPYKQSSDHDQVKILKGRKLISPKLSDTLSVKLLGGPNLPVFLDIVKNPDLLLSEEILPYYAYKMGEAVSIDGQLQFVVNFEPQMIMNFPLYIGTFYIDRETLSITRVEFSMDMRDKQKVTETILKEKPTGLRFTPVEVSYLVTYKQQGEKTYLNYVRNEIKFKCDWKRRLFATNYTVLGETVMTDRTENNVKRIPGREVFTTRQSLSKEVALYQDANFWSIYNIIEPTEYLENAVNKLKKAQLKSE
ncbi:MAG: carboxypeptidase-like regulatory domain-containing protein [Tannerella sp.]|jgi:hypothetical protein|nr:carboxypeptidase-like regulatory domain-containing protein [Tannerella sp.]